MPASATPSFLSLPPEIRVMIYRMIAEELPPLTLDSRSSFIKIGDRSWLSIFSQLLAVCRIIKREASPTLYGRLQTFSEGLEASTDFMHRIGVVNTTFLSSVNLYSDGRRDGCPSQILSSFERNLPTLHHLKRIVVDYLMLSTPEDEFEAGELRRRLAELLSQHPPM